MKVRQIAKSALKEVKVKAVISKPLKSRMNRIIIYRILYIFKVLIVLFIKVSSA